VVFHMLLRHRVGTGQAAPQTPTDRRGSLHRYVRPPHAGRHEAAWDEPCDAVA
jgi:hypothetical protein